MCQSFKKNYQHAVYRNITGVNSTKKKNNFHLVVMAFFPH